MYKSHVKYVGMQFPNLTSTNIDLVKCTNLLDCSWTFKDTNITASWYISHFHSLFCNRTLKYSWKIQIAQNGKNVARKNIYKLI